MMSDPSTYDATWKKNDRGDWQRNLIGLEHVFTLLTMVGQSNVPELASMPSLKIFSSALARVSSASDIIGQATLSRYMRDALRTTMYQVPNLTVKGISVGEPGGLPCYQVQYEQQVTDTEVEKWLDSSLEESIYPITPDTNIQQALAGIQTNLTPKEPFLLHAAYFRDRITKELSHIGLVIIMDHGSFDAIGTFLVLDKLLFNLAHQTECPPLKAEPENSKWECTPMQLRSEDLSAEIEAQKAVLDKENTHRTRADLPDLTGNFLMHCCRHRFSEEETTLLLQAAKRHNITITFLAYACLFIPILRHFPATEDEKVAHAFSLNARSAFSQLSSTFYNNCAASCHGLLSMSMLTENTRKGVCQTKDDAKSLIRLAKQLQSEVNKIRNNLLKASIAWDVELEQVMRGERPRPKRPDLIIHIADGLIDRYTPRHYSGEKLPLDVEDVTLYTNESSSFLYPRTATFAGRLTLQYSFNEGAWKSADVQRMTQDWADVLKYILLDQVEDEI